jgi:formylmethanofuran dehydrogenase subunit E
MNPEEGLLDALLRRSAARHRHLCPRQVLGVRMGLLAGRLLDRPVPIHDKSLLVIVEIDGCAADGVAVATGASIGKRTLRIEDFGKVAACVADVVTERAIRIAPRPEARELAVRGAPDAADRWHAQLLGYQRLSDEDLLVWRDVRLTPSLRQLISQEGVRVRCQRCGEEVFNERDVSRDGETLCRSCAGPSYYECC